MLRYPGRIYGDFAPLSVPKAPFACHASLWGANARAHLATAPTSTEVAR